ncbi:MAG: type III-B CRISPR-associated protein Cas10/Cmr2 [Planctomycetota bacterium]|nr:type III-B CRISPR-associated protein Cas10/Cmr2 [Planctomycetota bacterium]
MSKDANTNQVEWRNDKDFWRKLAMSFLAAPPDMQLGRGSREDAGARAAFSDASAGELNDPDHPLAAPAFPVSEAGELDRSIMHPLSGEKTSVTAQYKEDAVKNAVRDSHCEDADSNLHKFLKLWRNLPAECDKEYDDIGEGRRLSHLPYDMRAQGYSVWNQADFRTAMAAATYGRDKPVLLMFELGPVQKFIALARPVRDLWMGSYLLSWLVFQAMKPVITKHAPSAIISPSLRGNPLLDDMLSEVGAAQAPGSEKLSTAALTNVFFALVPSDRAKKTEKDIRNAVNEAWSLVCDKVYKHLAKKFSQFKDYADLWNAQTEDFLETNVALLPLDDLDKYTELFPSDYPAKKLIEQFKDVADKLGSQEASAAKWAFALDLVAKAESARRIVRHVPAYEAKPVDDKYGRKCTLFGSYEQIGPSDFDKSPDYWEKFFKALRRPSKSEKLCAIALVKRFAYDAMFDKKLKGSRLAKVSDTATIAATKWAERYDIKLPSNGQLLHYPQREEKFVERFVKDKLGEEGEAKEREAPPTYYALLVMDGDKMGNWLSGKLGPTLKECLSSETAEKLGDSKLLHQTRPCPPQCQAAISEALTNFSVVDVPQIVRNHGGFLAYSGGDDVLALLPAKESIECAIELKDAYQREYGETDHGLRMGSKATASAGLAIVHYKEALSFALNIARGAEKDAKMAGRNRLAISVVTGSGEEKTVVPWKTARTLQSYLDAFSDTGDGKGAVSNRWVYKLAQEAARLKPECDSDEKTDAKVAASLIKYYVGRMDKDHRQRLDAIFTDAEDKKVGDKVVDHFEEFCNAPDKKGSESTEENAYKLLSDFGGSH